VTREKRRFLQTIQHRAARVAVGASATRGQGGPGIVPRARRFFLRLRLARFGTPSQRTFTRSLDTATKRLIALLPKRSATWGLARKLLNIFLRDSLYTGYLSQAYRLSAAERLLEIPLDSITAKQIRKRVPGLPRWRGVKYLDQQTSAVYQAAALLIAEREGVARVHLDAHWWGVRE
jgi:hypothetical protein